MVEFVEDPEPYPGPPDQAYRLPWDDPMADVTFHVLKEVWRHRYQQLGKSLQSIFTDGLTAQAQQYTATIQGTKPIAQVIDEINSLTETFSSPNATPTPARKRNIGAGRVTNHGPRAKSTFDRRGKRRY